MAKKRTTGILAYSTWDVIPVGLAFVHLAYLIAFFLLFKFHLLPWWGVLLMGLVYAVSISWNINGISHNFIHNPYFRWPILNRLFSILESVSLLFSQQFYDSIHRRHHMGNADLPDEHGHTIDPISIYQHGHDGKPESMLAYTFLTFFRDDLKTSYHDIYRLNPMSARWAVAELVCTGLMFLIGFALGWKFMLVFIPFWYFGHCLSNLNGYYEHYKGKPAVPIAWGVSSYNWLYNVIWFNNGYHAEHHYRPRVHWTQMKALHQQIADEQKRAGVHVIAPPHALGFLQDIAVVGASKGEMEPPRRQDAKVMN
ncbi:MAG TPA: fatty acid desaturase [Tepidisphaeraceae bacterium]|jgi:fatty acid desaturase|nr:fatty acid desaturase [Tepidisphaeraceae bacterium]